MEQKSEVALEDMAFTVWAFIMPRVRNGRADRLS